MASLKKTAFIVTAFSVTTRIISFCFKIFLSRKFGAEVLGLFSMGLAAFGLLTMIPSSGIPLTISRKIAEYNAEGKNKNKIFGTVSAGLILALLINIAVVTIFIIFRKEILSLFSDKRAEGLVLIMIPATFSTSIYNIIRSFFMGKKNYLVYSITELIEELLNVIIVLLLISGLFAAINNNHVLAIAFTISDIICFVIIILIYFIGKGKLTKPIGIKDITKSSTPITFMRLFTSLAATFTAILLPNRLVDAGLTAATATAEYGRASGMAFPLIYAPLAITSSLSIVLLPEIAELNAVKNKKGISGKLDKSMNVAFIVSAFFFVVYYSLGEPLGLLLFNDERAGSFLSFASGMVLPLSLCQLTSTSLNSLGKEKICFVNNMIGLVIMTACLYFLPKYIGIFALAVAQTSFYFLNFLLNSIFLCKFRVTELGYYKPMFILSITSLILATLTSILQRFTSNLGTVSLCLCLLFVIIGFSLSLMLIRPLRIKLIVIAKDIRNKYNKKRR